MKGCSDIISKQDREELVREYFSAEGDEPGPYCGRCDQELDFELKYGVRKKAMEVRVSCDRCQYHFLWKHEGSAGEWEQLHLVYFYERYQLNQEIRCPVDDCFVVCQEYSDGPVRFRCPFCNREGWVDPGEIGDRADSEEPRFEASN